MRSFYKAIVIFVCFFAPSLLGVNPVIAYYVHEIILEGETLMRSKEKQELLAPYLHVQIDAVKINQLISDIKAFYVKKGYPTTQVKIPINQNLKSGTLHLSIIRGFIESIQLNKNKKYNRLQCFMAFPFMVGKPLLLQDLEQGVDQLNTLASNQARLQIYPGKLLNGSIVYIINTIREPYRLELGMDNLGEHLTKRYKCNLSIDNFLMLNDALVCHFSKNISSSPLPSAYSLRFSHTIPFGYYTFSSDIDYKTSYKLLNKYRYDSKTRTINLTLHRVAYKLSSQKLSVYTGLIFSRSRSFIEGVALGLSDHSKSSAIDQRLSSRQRRDPVSWKLGLVYSNLLYGSTLLIDGHYAQGTSWFGGGKDPIDLHIDEPKYQFKKVSINLSWRIPLGFFNRSFAYQATVSGQYTKDVLLSHEFFSLTGEGSVRGFSAHYSGDKGIAVQQKIEWTVPFFSLLPLRLFSAIDYGYMPKGIQTPIQVQLCSFVYGLHCDNDWLVVDCINGHPIEKLCGKSLDVKGSYDGVLFHADEIDIRAGKGHTTQLPQETIYDDASNLSETYKTGLLGFSYKKGTIGLDLKKEAKDFNQVNNTNVHLKKVGHKATKNITLTSQSGKVSIKGIDIISEQGSILLSGKQGVDTSAAVVNHTTSRRNSNTISTNSLGITNQFAAVGHKVADIADLGKAFQEAKKNYSQFRAAKASAQVALKKGEITEREYAQLAGQEGHHIASVTMATAALASGTADAAKSALEALPSVATFGFTNPGFTTATEHNYTNTNQSSQVIATSTIKGKNIFVESSEGSWVGRGGNVEAEKLNIKTKGADLSSFQVSQKDVKKGASNANSITYGFPTSFSGVKDAIKGIFHSTSGSIQGSTTSGENTSLSHHTTHIQANDVHIDADGDVSLKGGRIDAKTLTGVVTGKLDIETRINNTKSRDCTLGGGLSGGLVPNGINIGISGNIGHKTSNENKFTTQSGILATDHLDLKVNKVITNTGGILAASNGNMQLAAEDYVAKDRVTISTNNDIAFSGTLSGAFTKKKGEKTTVRDTSSASYSYKKGYSADKSKATLGDGTITLNSKRKNLGNRSLEDYSIHIGSSSVKTTIDSTTVKAIITPVKTAKHFVKDVTTLKDVTVSTVRTIASAKTLGVTGTGTELANNALDAYDANVIGKDPAFVKKIDQVATQSVHADEADVILNELEDRTTSFTTPAKVTAYRGNGAGLSDTVASQSNAFYSKSQDQKYVNIAGPDIKGADDVFGAIKHEEQRRANEHKPRLGKLSKEKKQLITDRRRKNAIRFAKNQGFTHRKIKLNLSTKQQCDSFIRNNELAGKIKNKDAEQFAPAVIAAGSLSLAPIVCVSIAAGYIICNNSVAREVIKGGVEKIGDAIGNVFDQLLQAKEKPKPGAVALPKKIKLVDQDYLKKKLAEQGTTPHELKEEWLQNDQIPLYDVYQDDKTGELIIYRQGGRGDGIPTGVFIK